MKKHKNEKGQRNRKENINSCGGGTGDRQRQYRKSGKCRYAAIIVSLSLLFTMQPIAVTAADPVQNLALSIQPDQASDVPEDTSGLLSHAKDKALEWLQKQLAAEPETDIPNDTLDILQLLRNEEKKQDVRAVCGWEKIQLGKNTDQDARYAAALCDEETMEEVIVCQNPDGGFGLAEGYQSDPLDTMLVLQGLQQCSMWQETETLLPYFAAVQQEDGGYSYTGQDASDPWMTARIGHEILMSKEGKTGNVAAGENSPIQDQLLQGIDTYVMSGKWDKSSEKDFLKSAWVSIYSYERGLLENAVITGGELLKLQLQDGSFYGNIQKTVAAVLLLNAIDHHLESITLDSIQTDCSTHILETEQSNTVQVTVKMNISVMKNQTLQLIVQAENRGQVIDSQTVSLPTDSNRQEYQETTAVVFDQPEYREGSQNYTIHTMLYNGEKCLGEITDIMAVRKKADRQIKLQAEVTTGQACGIRLDWNDISDEETTYGYRVYRQIGEQDWETRSTWNGQEKVKVLNVYPPYSNYLKTWMNTTISDSEEIAGRGVLDIDEVSFPQYNQTPDDYLKDDKGHYKYDVIMIGSADCNGNWDLSEPAYQATLSFTKTGRGILFGHDSILDYHEKVHPNLAKFGKQLGIVYRRCDSGASGNKVEIINNGFLTSYPWKLSGIKNVPYTHNSGQFVDTTLKNPATKWMRFCGFDADDDAYLITRNQYAMIQTGHSNGQASDDERKIIANTLFYLKQLTGAGQTEDKSFYDEAAPVIVSAKAEGNRLHITAGDKGTDYRYYVEGVPQAADKESKKSNTVEATALSGIRGYLMSVDDNPEEDDSLTVREEDGSLKAEILTPEPEKNDAETEPKRGEDSRITDSDQGTTQNTSGIEPSSRQDGVLTLPSGEREAGTWYIHLRAVDYAGNISEETTITFQQKEDRQPWFQTGYGLFSTEKDLNLNCSEAKIAGDIYSGRDFNFGGSILSVSGACRTVGSPNIYGWKLDVPQKITTEALDLPDYRGKILQEMQQSGTVQDLNCYNSTEIREPVICSRTTGAWCPDLKINADLACQGNISLNTNTLSAGETEPVVVMSQKGDITVNCTDFQFNGLLYAPEGTVSINVNQCRLAGTIIAKEIKLRGTYFTINQLDVP